MVLDTNQECLSGETDSWKDNFNRKSNVRSKTEEIELCEKIERGRAAREKLSNGGVSPEQKETLLNEIRAGWQAREHLIRANARLVISVAKKHIGRGVPFLDLIQEGNIGLIRAIKKYDYQRG